MPHTWHDVVIVPQFGRFVISIHMPHTWHDIAEADFNQLDIHFNPHATYVA